MIAMVSFLYIFNFYIRSCHSKSTHVDIQYIINLRKNTLIPIVHGLDPVDA